MKLYFRLCMAYAVVALVAVTSVRDIPASDLAEAGLASLSFAAVLLAAAKWAWPALVLIPVVAGPRRLVRNLGEVGYAVIGSVVFQVAVALTDEDAARRRRFIALFFLAWVGLGNALAIAGSSVGPVFYDGLLDSDRFALLDSALAASPIQGTGFAQVQDYLWQAHTDGGVAFGSGISAFPSVHVAVATMTMLYLYERRLMLVLPGILFLGAIFFLSIYSGYHYALDGYVSFVVVLGAWVMLRRAARRTRAVPALAIPGTETV
ncbi:MAG: phosphatase PAP2 family protein [Rhodobacteraceae bacterium]|nr:phosphatase PAP2 family protein [Paracoccaceae bacterium]